MTEADGLELFDDRLQGLCFWKENVRKDMLVLGAEERQSHGLGLLLGGTVGWVEEGEEEAKFKAGNLGVRPSHFRLFSTRGGGSGGRPKRRDFR